MSEVLSMCNLEVMYTTDTLEKQAQKLDPRYKTWHHHDRLGLFDPARVYDLFGEILAALSLFSLLFCLFLYIKVWPFDVFPSPFTKPCLNGCRLLCALPDKRHSPKCLYWMCRGGWRPAAVTRAVLAASSSTTTGVGPYLVLCKLMKLNKCVSPLCYIYTQCQHFC